jgi:hypothetical protein
MKAVVVKEIDEQVHEKVPQQVIEVSEAIIDELEIKDGFPKKVWEHRTYSKEEYFERKNSEKLLKPLIEVIPQEIVIRKLLFDGVYVGAS